MRFSIAISAALTTSVSAFPGSGSGAFPAALGERQNSENNVSSLVVDLGYEQYQGEVHGSTGLNSWLGYVYVSAQTKPRPIQGYRIRYAAPPTGSLRWQAPRAPAVNRGKVLSANTVPQRCPQSPMSPMLVYHL